MKETENLDRERGGCRIKKESRAETAVKVGGITEVLDRVMCTSGLRCDENPA